MDTTVGSVALRGVSAHMAAVEVRSPGVAVGRASASLTRARLEAPIEPIDATGAIRKIAMLGNHVPRQCGIATFTTRSRATRIAAERPELDCFVLAMNDAGQRHAYPPRVRFEIAESDLAPTGAPPTS